MWRLAIPLLLLSVVAIPDVNAQTWWERETALEPGGKLSLQQKAWWPQAENLKVGESIVLKSEYQDGGTMVVRREVRQRQNAGDYLLWILDDDGDMNPNDPQGDTDSDCYVADYGCDGVVDRLVDYMDANGDSVPDEMDIRYFVDGELRNVWVGVDLDGDGAMWDLIDYEYTGDFFKSDPYGNNMIYMNKYDPQNNRWLPISECPFAFYDTDGDGQSEITVRFSGAPMQFSPEKDPDYANSQTRYQGQFDPVMNEMGVANVRYSFDIDGMSSDENPLHYEMGFTLMGMIPYDFPDMNREHSLRRSPKTTVCIPYEMVCGVSDRYPARQTGFTWREFSDTSIRIGYPSRPEYDRRWEGVFWTWQRRILHNTGGPVQEWNVRREFRSTPSETRDLYYSPIDRRVHLKGAEEGWIRIGRLSKDEIVGENRFFDTDGDGYFDRWEYYETGNAEPYRVVTHDTNPHQDLGADWDAISRFYVETVLPEALERNRQLIEAVETLPADFVPALPEYLGEAQNAFASDDERRYLLDLIRDYRYRNFERVVRQRAQTVLDSLGTADPRSNPDIMKNSSHSWSMLAEITAINSEYDAGAYQEAANRIRDFSKFLSE